MSPVVQGQVRHRKHQFGRETDYGTAVAATRAYGWQGVPSIDPAWTDPANDTGSIDPVELPFRGIPEQTWTETTDALKYNDIPRIMSAFFGGNEVPVTSGTAETWTHEPQSTAVDAVDSFTGEFGDDVLTDWWQLVGGVLSAFSVTGADGLGALSASIDWLFGSARSTGSTDFPVTGTVPTPGLDVERNQAVVYLKDCQLRIADTIAGLSSDNSIVSDALHLIDLNGQQEWDLKRWANGDQSFDADAVARGERTINLGLTFSKTDQTVGTGSESDDWFAEQAVMRYVRLSFVSKVLANSPSTYHGWTVTLPLTYRTREDSEIANNTVVVLTGRAHFDPDDFEKVFQSVAVTQLSEADLGEIGS